MSLGQAHWSALRLELSRALRSGSALQSVIEPMLSDIANIEMGLPAHIGDYTDFYISLHHATSIGKQFRPDNPLLPNYKWVPIGYHGRARSEEHTSELQSLMRISYAVFCLKKKKNQHNN